MQYDKRNRFISLVKETYTIRKKKKKNVFSVPTPMLCIMYLIKLSKIIQKLKFIIPFEKARHTFVEEQKTLQVDAS